MPNKVCGIIKIYKRLSQLSKSRDTKRDEGSKRATLRIFR